MGASRCERDRKRILVEAEGRSRGWKKRALQNMHDEHDLQVVRRGGRIVGVRQRDSDLVVCRKRTFNVEIAARVAIAQTRLMGGENKELRARVPVLALPSLTPDQPVVTASYAGRRDRLLIACYQRAIS